MLLKSRPLSASSSISPITALFKEKIDKISNSDHNTIMITVVPICCHLYQNIRLVNVCLNHDTFIQAYKKITQNGK